MTERDTVDERRTSENRGSTTRRTALKLLGGGLLAASSGLSVTGIHAEDAAPAAIPPSPPSLDVAADVAAYDRKSVDVVIASNDIPWNRARLVVRLTGASGDRGLTYAHGPTLTSADLPTSVEIPVTYATADVDSAVTHATPDDESPVTYEAFLAPVDGGGPAYDRARYLCASDPFLVRPDSLVTRPYSTNKPSSTAAGFERRELMGRYQLRYDWWALESEWRATWNVEKRLYHDASTADRSIQRIYRDAVNNPRVRRLGERLVNRATAEGLSDERALLEVVRGFVYSLDYRRDEEATGVKEYPKYVTQTLVENGGDCEDLAALLAGLLSQQPFGYDAVLVFPVGHVAVGVAREDLPGDEPEWSTVTAGGTEYVLVETTTAEPLGELHRKYRDHEIAAVYDGEWRRLDANALTAVLQHVADKGNLRSVVRYL